jgi:hypothetical protein
MSPLGRIGCFSTRASGLAGSPQTICARRKMPCGWISSLFLLRLDKPASDRRQRSISSGVIDSSGISPNAGSKCAFSAERLVLQRRRFALAVLLDEPQPLPGRIGEGRPRSHTPRQRLAPGLVKHITQPRLGSPFRKPSHRRPTALRPRRSELLLDLTAVGQSVLRVPDRSAAALDPEDMARRDAD